MSGAHHLSGLQYQVQVNCQEVPGIDDLVTQWLKPFQLFELSLFQLEQCKFEQTKIMRARQPKTQMSTDKLTFKLFHNQTFLNHFKQLKPS